MALSKKPNILFLITDQQSAVPSWTEEWGATNFPAMHKLRKNGLTFKRGTINSCTCSPSRVTLFTGLYPAQHGVIQVLEFDDPDGNNAVKQQMQVMMSSDLPNMGKMMASAGYDVVFKGKWHLTKPVNYIVDEELGINQLYWTAEDVKHISERWGFNGWNAPDAGDNMNIANFGGGTVNNDGRFVSGNGEAALYGPQPKEKLYEESILSFFEKYNPETDKPFCLIVSLVNPHDVLSYPGTNPAMKAQGLEPIYIQGGYNPDDFTDIPVVLPSTVDEDLSTKPQAQRQWRDFCNITNGSLASEQAQTEYLQFYSYLNSMVDKQLNVVLEALDKKGLTDDTIIIRISDHGDMKVSHGYQRQKMYNMYKETLQVPFIISNPKLFPEPQETESLASLIDIMPTLATMIGIEGEERKKWYFKGKDLTPIIKNPNASVQDYIHYTYDDMYFPVPAAGHIRAIVEKDWKYAVYFDPNKGKPTEYELYNIAPDADPEEVYNLANPAYATPESNKQWERLHEKLTQVMDELGTMPDSIFWPNTLPKINKTQQSH
ncbi:MAG: sulfatase-like hydrolase/transferase [Bacteroidetes bacterium]|nr:MAG: sulfatase-like hydrolase/transferase [Bacteroidota bacterium]